MFKLKNVTHLCQSNHLTSKLWLTFTSCPHFAKDIQTSLQGLNKHSSYETDVNNLSRFTLLLMPMFCRLSVREDYVVTTKVADPPRTLSLSRHVHDPYCSHNPNPEPNCSQASINTSRFPGTGAVPNARMH